MLRIIAALAILQLCTVARADRFVAVRVDGTVETGDRLEDLFEYDEHGKLDGKSLLGTKNPLRVIRDTSKKAQRPKGWVELDNGDILAGQVLKFVPKGKGLPDHIVVAAAGLPMTGETLEIKVRAASVMAIYSTTQEPPLRLGEVRDRAGRMLFSSAVRWKERGLKLLTESGILEVEFGQLLAARFPRRRSLRPVLEDGMWLEKDAKGKPLRDSDRVVRVATENGSQLTFCRGMQAWTRQRRKDGNSRFYRMGTQPNWACSTVWIDRETVVRFAARQPHEIPISLLPAKVLRVRKGLHHLSWQRGESVLGNAPAIGNQPGGWCVGTHSHSEIAFQLPADAQSFSARVGFDPAVGKGGCVDIAIYKDAVKGKPIWQAKSFCGGSIKKIGPLKVSGTKNLILVTEFGDLARPKGADPLDIRDCVNWLDPLVIVKSIPRPETETARWIAALAGWKPGNPGDYRIVPRFDDEKEQRWLFGLQVSGDKSVRFSRKLKVTDANGWITLAGSRAIDASRDWTLKLHVNGERHKSTLNWDVNGGKARQSQSREYSLGGFVGKTVDLSLVLAVEKGSKPAEAVIESTASSPLIYDLPRSGRPLRPDVRLEDLKPARTSGVKGPLIGGRLANGKNAPLEVYRRSVPTGFGVPTGSELHYRLNAKLPEKHKGKRPREFVAVIGLAEGWKGAGPFEVLFDGKLAYSSASGYAEDIGGLKNPTLIASFTRNSHAVQVQIRIPEKARMMTLRLKGASSYGAWGWAGFRLGK